MSDILMAEIWDYQDSPPSVTARFWWSAAHGITCDTPWLLSILQKEGILAPEGRILYPSDGQPFFDALRFRFNGFERAQPFTVVPKQGGIGLS